MTKIKVKGREEDKTSVATGGVDEEVGIVVGVVVAVV